MGRNNQQRRRAKAKARNRAAARAANRANTHPPGSGPADSPGSPTSTAALSAHLTGRLLAEINRAWERGWEPVDVLRTAGRELRRDAGQAVEDIISLSLSQYAAVTVAPRWHDQLRDHDLMVWWPAASTPLLERLHQAGGPEERLNLLRAAAAAADLLASLPALQPVEAPPGTWRAATARPGDGPGPSPKMLERVRALLAKAESTPYEAEAETFTTAAQKLMARHSIDQALLAATNPLGHGPAPLARRLGVDRPYEAPKVALLDEVAGANRCRAVWMKNMGFVTVVGYADDVAATETLFTSLLLQATQAMTAQGSRRSAWGQSRTRSFRQSFLLAFASRIGQRLQEATQHEVDAHQAQRCGAEPAGGPGTELVAILQARAEEVDKAVDQIFGDLRATGPGTVRDAEGWAAGTHAADAAHLAGHPADTLTA